MSIINNDPASAEEISSKFKRDGEVTFKPSGSITYSESSAVSDLKDALATSKAVIKSFSEIAERDAENLMKINKLWQEKDKEQS